MRAFLWGWCGTAVITMVVCRLASTIHISFVITLPEIDAFGLLKITACAQPSLSPADLRQILEIKSLLGGSICPSNLPGWLNAVKLIGGVVAVFGLISEAILLTRVSDSDASSAPRRGHPSMKGSCTFFCTASDEERRARL